MGSRWRVPRAAAAAFALSTLQGTVAYGQTTSDGDKVAAETLFEDGRRLAEAGRYPEACPKFADSQKLDASSSTLLNLANCLEKLGRTATAWATFKQAGSLASATGHSDYVATADRRANALFAKVARLVVSAPHALAGMVIKRDNAVLEPSEWGSPIPIDAGSHLLVATAPGYLPWTSTVEIAQDGLEISVVVPQLEPLPGGAPASLAVPAPTRDASKATEDVPVPAPLSPTPNAPAPHRPLGPQRVVGLLVGGAGVASLGVGAVYGILAINKYHASQGPCEVDAPTVCEPQAVADRSDSRSDGNIATWTLGAGAAALVAGVVIWVTAPHGATEHPTGASWIVAPTLGGAVVRGVW